MILITDTQSLKEICQKLANQEYITVDTEFLREKTYYPQLCLIQVASEEIEFAVDPLAKGIELDCLFDVFKDEKIVKVFHSARQDIEILVNMAGFVPTPLFDTQVAATVCGFGDSVSYANLVSQILKQTVDKSSRFTDWSRRPLSKKQLDYAISDVTYLRDVYKFLKKQLQKTGRENWLTEEMESLTSIENYSVDADEIWKKLKPRSSSRRFLAIIKSLAKWRELKAQNKNRPRNFILRDQVLMEVAAVAPKNSEELKQIRGLNSISPQSESDILDCIKNAATCKESDLPPKPVMPKSTKGEEAYIDLLKILLKAKCSQNDVAEKIVATADDLKQIALGEHEKCKALKGWRFDMFGKYALALREGNIALTVKKNKILIMDL